MTVIKKQTINRLQNSVKSIKNGEVEVIDPGTEALLSEVLDWFRYRLSDPRTGQVHFKKDAEELEEFKALIHQLCSGDPTAANELLRLDEENPNGAYLTNAVDALDDQQLSIRILGADGMSEWSGDAATQFNDYRGRMSDTLNQCLSIAQGIRNFMNSFYGLVYNTHNDVRGLLEKVKQAQDQFFWKSVQVDLEVVGIVTDLMAKFAGASRITEAAALLSAMNSSATMAKDTINAAQNISGVDAKSLLESSIYTAQQLQSAVQAEKEKLRLTIGDLDTAIKNTPDIPYPQIVTAGTGEDPKYPNSLNEGDFWDGDPNNVDLSNLDS